MIRRVALAGGGTAGHVFPLLAVADAWRARRPEVELLFLGAVGGEECALAEAAGLVCVALPAAPLVGTGAGGLARALWCLTRGWRAARAVLAAHRIEAVLGSGGYVSAAPLLAARQLGLHTAILEPNVAPGLTNRVLGRLVDRVYLGHAAARARMPAARTLMTGIPVRPQVGAASAARRAVPRARVLVTGGSGGSPFLNREAPALLAALRERGGALAIHHQTGGGAAGAVAAAYAACGLDARVEPFIADMPAAYAAADVAITAAGAVTLAELVAAGLPALTVPLASAAADHQTANARAFAAAGHGRWVAEADWAREALADWLAETLHRRPATPPSAADAAAVIVADLDGAGA